MKKLTIENWHELQPWIDAAAYEDCNANIVTMLMWQFPYPFYFEVHDRFAISYFVISETEEKYWYMPFCKEEDRQEALEAMLAYGKQHGIPPRMTSVSKDWRSWLQEHYPNNVLFYREWDGKDYIYDRKQQETLSGKKMQKRRNHFNAFLKQYEGRYEFHRLSPSDFDDVLAFLRRWQNSKEEAFGIKEEEEGIRFLLCHFEELGLEGGVITIDGQLEAFSIVSPLTDQMLDIHVEKANREHRGLYVAILKLYLESADPKYTMINREDDMGLPALAKAKHDMHPIRIALKYSVRFEQWEIRHPRTEDIPAVKKLWLSSFEDEDEDSCAFYFRHLFRVEDCHIIASKDELIAMCMIPQWNVMIQGKETSVHFVEGVAVDKRFRRCGYLSLLMKHLDECCPDAIMALQAYDWDLYRPYGYEITHYGKRVEVDPDAYIESRGHLEEADASRTLSLYQECMKSHDAYRIRNRQYYEDFFFPYKKCCGLQTWLYVEDQKVKGFLSLHEDEIHCFVDEMLYHDEDALASMLALLACKNKKITVITDLNATIKGKSMQIPLLMMKPALPFKKENFISECI